MRRRTFLSTVAAGTIAAATPGSAAARTRETGDASDVSAGDSFEATVTAVHRGDTFDVSGPDGEERIRLVGVEAPPPAGEASETRSEDWPGFEGGGELVEWGDEAVDLARRSLFGTPIEVTLPRRVPLRDPDGTLHAHVEFENVTTGLTEFLGKRLLIDGLARVRGTDFRRHDEFRDAERMARDRHRGLWADSTPELTPVTRNSPVEELYFPAPASVQASWDRLIGADRVPVAAAASATQEFPGEGGFAWPWADDELRYDEVPLAAVDRDARVGMVGAPIVDAAYEASEGFPANTAGYGNFAFLTNLIDHLSDRADDPAANRVVVAGGSGQYAADYALTSEEMAYYRRYLEGVNLELDQQNDLSGADLDDCRAVIVSTPASTLSWLEGLDLRKFTDAGGAVILLGSGDAPAGARENLNRLAFLLGTDLRINDDQVTDPDHNLADDPGVVTTDRLDRSFPLFSAYSPGRSCAETVSEYKAGSLSFQDQDTYTYDVETDPCEVRVSLTGHARGEFHLYVTLDGRDPSRGNYDRAATGEGVDETIVLREDDLDTATSLGIAVRAYDGKGDYTLSIEETGN